MMRDKNGCLPLSRKEDMVQSSLHFDRDRFYHATPAPSVITQRNKESQFAAFLFLCYLLLVLMTLSGFTLLLYGGTLLKLWQLLLRLHPGLDTWISLIYFASLLMAFVGVLTHKVFDTFWSIRGFRRLYRTCRYIDPLQLMQYRLSYAMAAHPENFSYAFSGWVIQVQFRKKGQPDTPVSTEVLEPEDFSFFENVDPSADGSPLSSVELSEKPLPLDETEDGEADSSSSAMEDTDDTSPLLSQKDEPQFQPEENMVFEEREASSEAQPTQAVPEGIQERLRLIISLRETVTLFLLEKRDDTSEEGPREKRVPVSLGNVTYQALIAFLAQDTQKSMNAESLMNRVYAHVEDKERVQTLFNKHISRIRKQMRKGIRNEFPHWAPAAENFDVFKNEMDGHDSLWRLSSTCVVSGMDLLKSFYNEMYALAHMKKTQSIKDQVKEKKLLNNAHRLIKYYSGNYLEKNQNNEEGYVGGYPFERLSDLPFRDWATPFFKECRRKYIFCIEQVAAREDLLWQEVKQPEYLENATKLYKECAYAATCAPIDHKLGEHALRACLTLYRKAREEVEAAEAFYETYKRRVYRIEAEWVPEKETKALLYDIGFLEE